MASKSVDTKQLRWHSYELASTGAIVGTAVEAVTKLAVKRIQAQAREAFTGTRHWSKTAQHISTEVTRSGSEVKGVVGYERGQGNQASLAHLLEYGSSKFGPIKQHLGPALDANEEPYEKALLAAATAPLAKGIGPMGGIKR